MFLHILFVSNFYWWREGGGSVGSLSRIVLCSQINYFFTRENHGCLQLWTFILVEGEKMKSELILPRNEMRGEITKFVFTKLCLYIITVDTTKQQNESNSLLWRHCNTWPDKNK